MGSLLQLLGSTVYLHGKQPQMVQYVAVFPNKTLFTKTEANKQTKKKQRKTKIKRREKKQKQKTGPDGLWPWFQSLYFRNMLSQSSL